MSRIFVTAFEPYDCWSENSSWLALMEFIRSITTEVEITTRLYPVDLEKVRQRLEEDLDADFDYAIHLGQSPGATQIHLEAVGLNVGGNSRQPSDSYRPLVEEGPVAYRSSLPLGEWVHRLRENGIPATVSYHAGTYMCNAMLYLTHYLCEKKRLKTQATFLHLPLAPSQAASSQQEVASLPSATVAQALTLIIESLARQQRLRGQELA